MGKSTNRQFLVKVSGVNGFFAMMTGGNPKASSTRAWDGGALVPDVLVGPAERSDLTVRRPYDYDRDQPVIDELEPLVGQDDRRTITVWPTNGKLEPLGRSTTYDGTLMEVIPPQPDAKSSEAADFGLTFAVRNATPSGASR